VKFGVVSSKQRKTGRQRNRANPQVVDTKDYWFLYHLLNELRCRLVKNADQFLAQLLLSINLNKLKREDELHIYDASRVDLQTRQDQVRPSHICETLELVSKKLYPHLCCILKIYLTMPPSTATAERSFSVLKRVKTQLRATM